jgi:hypothetical protein
MRGGWERFVQHSERRSVCDQNVCSVSVILRPPRQLVFPRSSLNSA